MLMTRLTRGSRTSDRNHHQGWYQDVDQGDGQEDLVDRECRGRHLAVERSVENISAEEPEDVDVCEHEQHAIHNAQSTSFTSTWVSWYCLVVVVLTGSAPLVGLRRSSVKEMSSRLF